MTRPKPKEPELPEELREHNRSRTVMSGFCAYPSPGSHGYCDQRLVPRGVPCLCPCHEEDPPPSMEGFGTVKNFLKTEGNP